MSEPVLQQTVNTSILVNEFDNRKEGKKGVTVKGCFAVYARINVCKAYKNWMGHVIPGNDQSICLV